MHAPHLATPADLTRGAHRSPTWHVIIGTNYGSHVVHATKHCGVLEWLGRSATGPKATGPKATGPTGLMPQAPQATGCSAQQLPKAVHGTQTRLLALSVCPRDGLIRGERLPV